MKHPESIVVIGASAAGLRAAARAKRLLPQAKVVVVDQTKDISLGACGLPYFLSGDIENVSELRSTAWGAFRDPKFFKDVKNLDVLDGTQALSIDRDNKQVHIKNLDTGEVSDLVYDKLVIATGATPKTFPGIEPDGDRVTAFKNTEDAKLWRSRLEANKIDKVAIIGGGFIGVELAEAFGDMWGAEVDMIEGESRVMPWILDPEMSAKVAAHMKSKGVRMHLGQPVKSIEKTEDGLKITLKDEVVETQYAVIGLGVTPNVELAKEAGITIGKTGAITVDEKMLTNDPDIYAAGDCVEVALVHGHHTVLPLGSLANRQGRTVGDNLGGRKAVFGKVAASCCVKAFEFNVAASGLTQLQAKRFGIETKAVWGTFTDIADYFPESKLVFIKLIYEPGTKKLVGFQGVGPGEVVKRADVFGNLLKRGGTLEDLKDLEFAYAPPYAPAVDPLFSLGCVAINEEDDNLVCVEPDASYDGRKIVDVRLPGEREKLPLEKQDYEIPLEEIRARVDEVQKGDPLMVICMRGSRSAEAARILMQAGHEDVVFLGGGALLRQK